MTTRVDWRAGILGLLLGSALACASNVSQDYDPEIDFSRYRTFDWSVGDVVPTGSVELDNPLLHKRIRKAVERTFVEKGFVHVEDTRPDFFISFHLAVERRLSSSGVRTSIGGYGRHGGISVGGGETLREIEEGTLAVDVLDGRTHELSWRGVGRRRLRGGGTPEESTRAVNRIVVAILESFPPKTRD